MFHQISQKQENPQKKVDLARYLHYCTTIHKREEVESMTPMQAVRQRIQELRLSRGMSVNALAAICGICSSSLHNILTGRQKNVSISMVQMICDGLEINLTEFFGSELFRDVPEAL